MKKFVYFLFALAVVFLFAFQIQEEQKFYYAFDEKISLMNVDNKFVVRYSHNVDKENASSGLRKTYDNSSLLWHDERTLVLTLDSKVNTKEVVDNIKQLSDVASLQPLYKINTGLEMIITDEFVVKFKANAKKADIQMINGKFGTTLVKETDTYLLLKVARGGDALDVANQYQESGLVEFSHPNFIIQVEKHQQVIPNDPYFVNQFTLNNTGQVFNDGHFGMADADIDSPEAWAMTTGVNNILVAVLDEGISPNHPDLPNARQVRLNGSNFTDGNQNDPSPTNNMNHGNSCAGVIAATQNNNEGIAGICPNCRIMPIRIFNSNPTIGLTPTQLADAMS